MIRNKISRRSSPSAFDTATCFGGARWSPTIAALFTLASVSRSYFPPKKTDLSGSVKIIPLLPLQGRVQCPSHRRADVFSVVKRERISPSRKSFIRKTSRFEHGETSGRDPEIGRPGSYSAGRRRRNRGK